MILLMQGTYGCSRHNRITRPAPIQPVMRTTPGAGLAVDDAVAGACVGGRVGGGRGLVVTTCVTSVVAMVVTGSVTGAFVVTGAGCVVCTGITVAGAGEEVISGLILWINRLPCGSTGVIVFPGTS